MVLGIGANTIAQYRGWTVTELDPEALSEQLRPYYRISKPAGEGPFPTALLYSGCDGPKDNMARWSAMLVGQGWTAIVVDSHTPRELGDFEVWRLVCSGQLLTGAERAGDVLVSLSDAGQMPFVDPGRIALIGMSHGGWSIMDLMAFDPPDKLPWNLAAMPAGMTDRWIEGIVGLILVYPWCGSGNRAAEAGWRHKAPVLFLLAAEDTIAPSVDCVRIAEKLEANASVEVRRFENVTHGFDQQDRNMFSTLSFSPEATAEALTIVGAFLDRIAASPVD